MRRIALLAAIILAAILFSAGAAFADDISREEITADPRIQQLCDACNKGDLDNARSLVNDNVNINGHCFANATPLTWACFRGHTALVLFLLDKGAKINLKDKNEHSPLFSAVRGCSAYSTFNHPESCMDVVKILLRDNADIEATDMLDFTPLMYAAQDENLAMVLFLLRSGANINARTQFGTTALTLAQKKANLELVRALKDLGAK